MKQHLMLILLIIGCSSLLAQGVQPVGNGTEYDPYQVANIDNLVWLSCSYSWHNHYIQTADIDASASQIEPIGNQLGCCYLPFSGAYNGQGFVIDGLTICNPQDMHQGLFGYAEYAIIENLGLTNVSIIGNYGVGGLVGEVMSTTVSNCYIAGNISGEVSVGGLVGRAFDSIISNCYSTGDVSGDSVVGGLLGDLCSHNSTALLSDSYSLCNVSGNDKVGGLLGYIYSSGMISNCFYNYETTQINGEHLISIGALNSIKFEIWRNNSFFLNINDYLTLSGNEYLISSIDDLKDLLAFGQNPLINFRLDTDLDLAGEAGFY
ncbi:MAG: hypothetical protein K8S56_00935, partial [Candidatus Cloacimonetes bacterium]|nr:hypothetical protein [Candidatus Cloacimonadota bacterium]